MKGKFKVKVGFYDFDFAWLSSAKPKTKTNGGVKMAVFGMELFNNNNCQLELNRIKLTLKESIVVKSK